MGNSIYHSSVIYNRLIPLNLGQIFSSTVMKHILSILISVFLRGYRGKTVDFACASPCHRTTIAHFLCCTGTGKNSSFKEGYAFLQREILIEKITYIYQCGSTQIPLDDVLALVG